MNYITNEDWCSLSSVVDTTAKHIWTSGKLPNDIRLSYDELRSDCYIKCGKLVSNYQPGELSLKSYVFEWLEKYVYKALMDDYSKLKKEQLVYIDATDRSNVDYFNEDHEYGEYEVAASYDDKDKFEKYDIVKNIYEKANQLDKMIIDMILEGKEITTVAKEVGISARQIYRRLQKYRSIK